MTNNEASELLESAVEEASELLESAVEEANELLESAVEAANELLESAVEAANEAKVEEITGRLLRYNRTRRIIHTSRLTLSFISKFKSEEAGE